jgi:acetylornithine aminotransferase
MANGFPIGGVLISPQFQATKGMLGTTFGGNYLAMAGAHAVLDIIRKENLLENVSRTGAWLKANIPASPLIKEVRGEGLMLGIEFTQPVADIRKKLLFEKHIFTGVSGTSMIRLLAPLVLSVDDAAIFVQALKEVLNA